MGKFGWSYPPGCKGPPYDDEHPCEVCGKMPEDCICPECPECGAQGDPECYGKHGLVKTQEQVDSLRELEKAIEEEQVAEARYFEALEKERDREDAP
jgi:hypothetical protein